MDFAPTETQTAVGELARRIFKDAQRADRGDTWKTLARAGLLGTAVPDAFGGAGHGLLELCTLMYEAGAAASREPLWAALALGALPVAGHGTDDQKRRLLPGVVAGKHLLTGALEPSDVRAAPNGSGWKLDGVVDFVPEVERAARVLVPARTAAGRNAAFLVDPDTVGVTVERQVATSGDSIYRLELAGARVREEDVMGDVGVWARQRATVALCAMELGVCERALRMTAKYTSERHQFDRPIATFQAVAQRAADAYIDVETIRLATWEAAWRLSRDLPAARAVAIAKLWAAEAGHRVVYAAQHLHGGIGFDLDYPLGQYYLRSKQIELALGCASEHAARLGELIADD